MILEFQDLHRVGQLGKASFGSINIVEWDIPCIARVMVRITLSGGVSNVSQRAGWNNF